MSPTTLTRDGMTYSVIVEGEGPLVLLVHGFPELGYSWRRVIPGLVEAGYRVAAPDMRGYGGTDKPADVDAYSILDLVGDLVAVVHALGETQAVVVGHDWGAPVAWHAALLRPDVFRAVAGLSMPFQPRKVGKEPIPTLREICEKGDLGTFYVVAFQEPGAEDAFDRDPETALRKAFYAYDGATPDGERSTGFYRSDDWLGSMATPPRLPPWMSEDELAVYVRAFSEGGFFGPIAWYRNIDRNHRLMRHAQERRIVVPGLFVVGDRDPVRGYVGAAEIELKRWVPDLRGRVVVPGAGHWIQQERPDAVLDALLPFLRAL